MKSTQRRWPDLLPLAYLVTVPARDLERLKGGKLNAREAVAFYDGEDLQNLHFHVLASGGPLFRKVAAFSEERSGVAIRRSHWPIELSAGVLLLDEVGQPVEFRGLTGGVKIAATGLTVSEAATQYPQVRLGR